MKDRDMDIQELRSHYNSIRQRLLNPPNAVFDIGINLRRHRIPTYKPLKAETKIEFIPGSPVLEYLPQEPPKPIKFAAILRAVSAHFDVGIADIRSITHKCHIVLPRHVALYLGVLHVKRSMNSICRDLGRHHSTGISAVRRITKMISMNDNFRATVRNIEKEILAGKYS
jgi:hypothetical protein